MAKGLSTFHFSVLCWLGLSLRAFVLRYVPTLSTLMTIFFLFKSWMELNFVECFFCICWNDHVNFVHPSFLKCGISHWLIDLQVSLPFNFTILIIIFLHVSLFEPILFGTLCAFCIWRFLLQVWEIFSYKLSNTFSTTFSLFSPSGPPIVWILVHLILFQMFLKLL